MNPMCWTYFKSTRGSGRLGNSIFRLNAHIQINLYHYKYISWEKDEFRKTSTQLKFFKYLKLGHYYFI